MDLSCKPGPLVELAKAMIAYKGTGAIMDETNKYCAEKSGDDATTATLHGAVDSFEAALSDALDDLRQWTLQGNSGAPQTLETMTAMLKHALDFTVAIPRP